MEFLKELYSRWNEGSPLFFKKVQKLGAWLTATGTGLIGIPATLNATVETNMDLGVLGTVASYMVLGGLIMTIVAKLPVNNNDYEKPDKNTADFVD